MSIEELKITTELEETKKLLIESWERKKKLFENAPEAFLKPFLNPFEKPTSPPSQKPTSPPSQKSISPPSQTLQNSSAQDVQE
jgi:hypothetical protein